MKSKRNKSAFIGIAVALVLPLSFYIIAKVLGKDKLDMPVYYRGADTIPSHEAMKMVHNGTLKPVDDLEAVNQFGDRVSLNKDLSGKMLVVHFFFTTCTSQCPQLNRNIRMLESAFRRTPMKRNDTMAQFISITVDPASDSVSALRAYARASGVNEDHWWFITGDKRRLYNWARTTLHLSVPAGDGGADDTIHTKTVVLLDQDHFIRGYYDGLDTAAIIRCANDMGKLAMEKKHE